MIPSEWLGRSPVPTFPCLAQSSCLARSVSLSGQHLINLSKSSRGGWGGMPTPSTVTVPRLGQPSPGIAASSLGSEATDLDQGELLVQAAESGSQ
jgi:hypothetical protein